MTASYCSCMNGMECPEWFLCFEIETYLKEEPTSIIHPELTVSA